MWVPLIVTLLGAAGPLALANPTGENQAPLACFDTGADFLLKLGNGNTKGAFAAKARAIFGVKDATDGGYCIAFDWFDGQRYLANCQHRSSSGITAHYSAQKNTITIKGSAVRCKERGTAADCAALMKTGQCSFNLEYPVISSEGALFNKGPNFGKGTVLCGKQSMPVNGLAMPPGMYSFELGKTTLNEKGIHGEVWWAYAAKGIPSRKGEVFFSATCLSPPRPASRTTTKPAVTTKTSVKTTAKPVTTTKPPTTQPAKTTTNPTTKTNPPTTAPDAPFATWCAANNIDRYTPINFNSPQVLADKKSATYPKAAKVNGIDVDAVIRVIGSNPSSVTFGSNEISVGGAGTFPIEISFNMAGSVTRPIPVRGSCFIGGLTSSKDGNTAVRFDASKYATYAFHKNSTVIRRFIKVPYENTLDVIGYGSADQARSGVQVDFPTGHSVINFEISNLFPTARTFPIQCNLQSVIAPADVQCEKMIASSVRDGTSMGGNLFVDSNGDKKFTPGEKGVAGAEIILSDSIGVIARIKSGADGSWLSGSVPAGSYVARVDPTKIPIGYTQSSGKGGIALTLRIGQRGLANFAFSEIQPGGIEGTVVKEDEGGANGVVGVAGIMVDVVDSAGATVQTLTTDSMGKFSATSIPAGTYSLRIKPDSIPQGLSPRDATSDTTQSVSVFSAGKAMATFTYRQTPGSGVVTGTVRNDANGNRKSDSGEKGLAGVKITLLDRTGKAVGSATTDANGTYSARNLPAGTLTVRVEYSTVPAGLSPVSDTDKQQQYTLKSGETISMDFFYRPAESKPAGIAGRVYRDDQSAKESARNLAIPLVKVWLMRGDQVIETATTDDDGRFRFIKVAPGDYTVRVDQRSLPANFSPRDPDKDKEAVRTIKAGETLGVFFCYRADGGNTLIEGRVINDPNSNRVIDPNEVGIPNVKVLVVNQSGRPIAIVYTDMSGKFRAPSLPAGRYTIRIDQDSIPKALVGVSAADKETSATTNLTTTTTVNFFYRPATGTKVNFTGRVLRDDVNGVEDPANLGLGGVKITIKDKSGKIVFQGVTDASGSYMVMDLEPGEYTLEMDQSTLPEGFNPRSPSDIKITKIGKAGDTVYTDFWVRPATGPAHIRGGIISDGNCNRKIDDSETGLANVTVTVTDKNNRVVAVVRTNSNGNYAAPSLPIGSYTVKIDQSSVGGLSPASDSDSTLTQAVVGGDNIVNFFYSRVKCDQSMGTIEGRVYRDDKGGTESPANLGIPEIRIQILDRDTGLLVATTTTDMFGNYKIRVPAGIYIIRPDPTSIPKGFTPRSEGDKEQVRQVFVDRTARATFCYTPADGGADIEGTVTHDENGNRVRDVTDKGIASVNVSVSDESGRVIAFVVSDENGKWRAPRVPAGKYTVRLAPVPTGYVPVEPRDKEATATVLVGSTAQVHFYLRPENARKQPARIIGTVFFDTNQNAILDGTEPGLMAGIKISARDQSGAVVGTAVTDSVGKYVIENLQPGTYVASVDAPGPPGYTKVGTVDVSDAKRSLREGQTEIVNFPYRDVNECFLLLANCHENGVCTNTQGSFTCMCEYGYSGDGIVCAPQTQVRSLTSTIMGTVFVDLEQSNTPGSLNPPMAGVRIMVMSDTTKMLYTAITDANGQYEIKQLNRGNYMIKVDQTTIPNGYIRTNSTKAEVSRMLTQSETAIINFAYRPTPVSVSGSVFEDVNGNRIRDDGEPGIAGIKITITDKITGNVIGTVIADQNGTFKYPDLPPGTYSFKVDPASIPPGYISVGPTEITKTFAPGETPTIDFFFAKQTGTLTGFIPNDLNGNGKVDPGEGGLAGIKIYVVDPRTNRTLYTTITDANGKYSIPNVIAGSYIIRPDPASFPPGYNPVSSADLEKPITLSPAGTTNTDFFWAPKKASVTGSIFSDNTGNGVSDGNDFGLEGIKINVYNEAGAIVATVTSDKDGKFVIPDLIPGIYKLRPDPSTVSSGYTPNSDRDREMTLILTPGQAANIYFAYKPRPGSVSGVVFQDNNADGKQTPDESGLAGIRVLVVDQATGQVVTSALTDDTGRYSLAGIVPGNYLIRVDPKTVPEGYKATGATDLELPLKISAGQSVTANLAYTPQEATIGGSIFQDFNLNGVPEATEPGVAGIKIIITDRRTGQVVATVTTDSNGKYSTTLPPGTYDITVDQSTVPTWLSAISDLSKSVTTTLTPGQTASINFGYKPQWAKISGVVFRDANKNTAFDSSDPGMANIVIVITDSATTKVISTRTTDANGRFVAPDLIPGNYEISVDKASIAGYRPIGPMTISKKLGPGESIEVQFGFNDINECNEGTYECHEMAACTNTFGSYLCVCEYGYYGTGLMCEEIPPSTVQIRGTVYLDQAANGIQDDVDVGIPGVLLQLINDGTGQVVQNFTTDEDGRYTAPPLAPGRYIVKVAAINPLYTLTSTPPVVEDIRPGQWRQFNFGYKTTGCLVSGVVFEDQNGSGVKDSTDVGLAGVKVGIFEAASGKEIGLISTNADGNFAFPNVPAGNYVFRVDQSSLPAGYQPTSAKDKEASVTAVGGQNQVVNFGYKPPSATISGVVFEDTSNTRTLSADSPRISGVAVAVINPDTGAIIARVPTDSNGAFSASFTRKGNFLIRVEQATVPSSMVPASDADKETTVTLLAGESKSVNFAYVTRRGGISGLVYGDVNHNGIRDPTEQPLAGVKLNIVDRSSGAIVGTAATDATGKFTMANIPPGTYVVKVDEASLPSGWSASTADSADVHVTVVAGQTAELSMGFCPKRAVVEGRVVQDRLGTGIPEPNAIGLAGVRVSVIEVRSNVILGTESTDSSGRYAVPNLLPGTYAARVDANTLPTGYEKETKTSQVTVAAGEKGVVDFSFKAMKGSVSGTVLQDNNNNGIVDAGEPGIAGAKVVVTDKKTGSAVTIATVDSAGKYSVDIPPGMYTFSVDQSTIPSGFTPRLAADKETVVTVAPNGNHMVDFSYRPVAAFVRGTVYIDTDASSTVGAGEAGLPGIRVVVYDRTTGIIAASGVTNTTGMYSVGVSTPGDYVVRVDQDTIPSTHTPTSAAEIEKNVTVQAGASVSANFGYKPKTTSITGVVFQDNNENGGQDGTEPGLANIKILITDKATNKIVATPTTDASGRYSAVSLPSGTYSIQIDPAAIPASISATEVSTTVDKTIIAGDSAVVNFPLRAHKCGISGTVFYDTANNGVFDSSADKVYAGVRIVVVDKTNGKVVATAVTDSTGKYSIGELPPGTYVIRPDQISYPFGMGPSRAQDFEQTIEVKAGDKKAIDIAFREFKLFIVGVVNRDLNGNGFIDADEDGVSGVKVVLVDKATNKEVGVATADSDGKYRIAGLEPGTYIIRPDPNTFPAGLAPTSDSDRESTYTLETGRNLLHDINLRPKFGVVSGLVFVDSDRNGVQGDKGEPGMPGVKVIIADQATGAVRATALTDSTGRYAAVDIPAGTFTVRVDPGTVYGNMKPATADVTITVVDGQVVAANFALQDVDECALKAHNCAQTATCFNTLGSFMCQCSSGYAGSGVACGDILPKKGAIQGIVFEDVNSNAKFDNLDEGFAGVKIVVIDRATDKAVATTVTDQNGRYYIPDLSVGVYIIRIEPTTFPANHVLTDESLRNLVRDLTDGATITQDFPLRPIQSGVSGKVFQDINFSGVQDASEIGLAGVKITITNSANLSLVAVTDSQGAYSVPSLAPGAYVLTVDQSTLPANHAAVPTGGNVIRRTLLAGEDASINFAFAPARAIIRGKVSVDQNKNGVWESTEAGLANVRVVIVNNATGVIVTSVTTDANGNYTAEVPPGTYVVRVEGASVPPGYSPTTDVDRQVLKTVLAGQTATVNFCYKPQPSSLDGSIFQDNNKNGVKDSSEPGLAGIKVVVTEKATGKVVAMATTDVNGKFSVPDLPPGLYVITPDPATIPEGYIPTSDADRAMTVEVKPGMRVPVNFSYTPKNIVLSGIVFQDRDGNGNLNASDVGLSGIRVSVVDKSTGGVVATATTDANGRYSATNLGPGTYVIRPDPASIPANHDAVSATDRETEKVLVGGDSVTVNFAYRPRKSTATGVVHKDVNANGMQDAGESGIAGARVSITDKATGLVVAVATTDASGKYTIPDLSMGTFDFRVDTATVPAGWLPTGNSVISKVIAAGETVMVDFPFKPKSSAISGSVFADSNRNGIMDQGESGLGGIKIVISDKATGGVVAVVTTDPSGKYTIPDLKPGTYVIRPDPTTLPAGFEAATTADVEREFVVDAGTSTIGNFGFRPKYAKIMGTVYFDRDRSGAQDLSEPGIANVPITILDASGKILANITTDDAGRYSFPNLGSGKFILRVSKDSPSLNGYTPVADQSLESTKTLTAGDVATINFGWRDYDECMNAKDNCHERASCINTLGSFVCVCEYGYSGNGVECKENTPRTGAIQGVIFEDKDGSSTQSLDESGLSGVTITFLNQVGVSVSTVTSDVNGRFSVPNLPPATYLVRVDPGTVPAGYAPTTTEDKEVQATAIADGTTNVKFAYKPLKSTLRGVVFQDTDGSGTQAQTESGLSNIRVIVIDGSGKTVATVSTGATGTWEVPNLIPGKYVVKVDPASVPAYHTPTSAMDKETIAVLRPGEEVVANFAYRPAKAAIDGYVYQDNNANSAQDSSEPGLAGIRVVIVHKATNMTVGAATTDSMGHYTVSNLDFGSYIVRPDPTTFPQGYTPSGDADKESTSSVTPGETADANFGLKCTKGTFSGSIFQDKNGNGVMDAGESGLAGVKVTLLDKATGKEIGTATTDANGKYTFSAVVPGTYTIRVDQTTVPAGHTPSTDADRETTVTLTPSGTPTVNFSYKPRPGTVEGIVFQDNDASGKQDAGEVGMAGVRIIIVDKVKGATVATVTTDGMGRFVSSNLIPDDYIFQVEPTSVTDGYDPNSAADKEVTVSIKPAQTTAIAFAYKPRTGSFTGRAVKDLSGTGVTNQTGIEGAQGVRISIIDSNGKIVANVTTDSSGNFKVPDLPFGTYTFKVDPSTIPSGWAPISTTDLEVVKVLRPGQTLDVSFCFKPKKATISGTVFADRDEDGTLAANETGMPGVRIHFVNKATNQIVASFATDSLGKYLSADLAPGTYVIRVDETTVAAGYVLSGSLPEVTLSPGGSATANIGYKPSPVTVTGSVYDDANGNRAADANEKVLSGVSINFKDKATGKVVATVKTDSNGKFSINNLPFGSYVITPDPTTVPKGYAAVTTEDMETLRTFKPGESMIINFFFRPPASKICGRVFGDKGNGVFDDVDPLIAGSVITITNTATNVNITVTTGTTGNYSSLALTAGTYSVRMSGGYHPSGFLVNNSTVTKILAAGEIVYVDFALKDMDECAANTDNCDSSATCSNTLGSFLCRCEYGYNGTGVVCSEINPGYSTIQGQIWEDLDASQNRSFEEPGIGVVRVIITYANSSSVATVTADAYGLWNSPLLPPGQYIVQLDATTLPNGYYFTTPQTVLVEIKAGQTAVANFGLKYGIKPTTIAPATSSLTYTGIPTDVESSIPFTGMPTATDQAIPTTSFATGQYNTRTTTVLPTSVVPTPTTTGASTTTAATGTCTSAADCGFDGVCTGGKCTCNNGITWTADGCLEGGECAVDSHNCSTYASCMPSTSGPMCTCLSGYYGDGKTCEVIRDCTGATHNCAAQATCFAYGTTFGCTCNYGYTGDGKTCARPPTCTSTTCSADSTCYTMDGANTCVCNEGYVGNGTFCKPNYCAVGSHNCDVNSVCLASGTTRKCTCRTGYTGDGTTCTPATCANAVQLCGVNAECIDFGSGDYDCLCNDGYVNNGTACVTITPQYSSAVPTTTATATATTAAPTSVPAPTPAPPKTCTSAADCGVDATCVGGKCTCASGLTWTVDGCTDAPECAAGSHNCSTYASCMPSTSGPMCTCLSGYYGDGITCEVIRDCTGVTHNCAAQATCFAYGTTFGCTCNYGYTGDGKTCARPPTCTSTTCSADSTCYTMNGANTCVCNDGYIGNGTFCKPDFCAVGSHNCDVNAVCVDSGTTKKCTCRPGYTGDGTTCTPATCANAVQLCGVNAECIDFGSGDYDCLCNDGYVNNGTACVTIPPQYSSAVPITTATATATTAAPTSVPAPTPAPPKTCTSAADCGVDATCVGGKCTCASGLTWTVDGCTDAPECAAGTHNCSAYATCMPSTSGPVCACLSGYYGDGKTCEVIGDCTGVMHNCAAQATCFAYGTTFGCTCNDGYTGDGKTCALPPTCTSTTCSKDATCYTINGANTCVCNDGYIGNGTFCKPNFCAVGSHNCDVNAICLASGTTKKCMCQTGYTGDGTTCKQATCSNAAQLCGANAVCIDLGSGDYDCLCNDGYVSSGLTCVAAVNPAPTTTSWNGGAGYTVPPTIVTTATPTKTATTTIAAQPFVPVDESDDCVLVNGTAVAHGEIFSTKTCLKCSCSNGTVTCDPSCAGCTLKDGVKIAEYGLFSPDGCNDCTCSDGEIYCTSEVCTGCKIGDLAIIDNGQTIKDPTCGTCTCTDNVLTCSAPACATNATAIVAANNQVQAANLGSNPLEEAPLL